MYETNSVKRAIELFENCKEKERCNCFNENARYWCANSGVCEVINYYKKEIKLQNNEGVITMIKIYTCKNCNSQFDIKRELLRCTKCDKQICVECVIKEFSNVSIGDSYYQCQECSSFSQVIN